MAALIVPLVVLFAIALAIPPRGGQRVGFAVGLGVIALVSLRPKIPMRDMGSFDGMEVAFVGMILVPILGGIGLRAALATFIWPIQRHDSAELRRADQLLALAAGGLAGTVATLFLAATLRGQSGGLGLHVVLAAAAAGVAGVVLWRLPMVLPRLFLASMAATMAALILWGGLAYPALIRSEMARISPEFVRCLRTGDRAPSEDEFRLLTLPMATFRNPNLILTVMRPEGPRHFRWSYRSLGFRSYASYPHGNCPAQP